MGFNGLIVNGFYGMDYGQRETVFYEDNCSTYQWDWYNILYDFNEVLAHEFITLCKINANDNYNIFNFVTMENSILWSKKNEFLRFLTTKQPRNHVICDHINILLSDLS